VAPSPVPFDSMPPDLGLSDGRSRTLRRRHLGQLEAGMMYKTNP
jgi:hypothetical protein